jgi:hypothetical protein
MSPHPIGLFTKNFMAPKEADNLIFFNWWVRGNAFTFGLREAKSFRFFVFEGDVDLKIIAPIDVVATIALDLV